MTLLADCQGHKIYYDAREALLYLKRGRPGDDRPLFDRVSRQIARYTNISGNYYEIIRRDTEGWELIIS